MEREIIFGIKINSIKEIGIKESKKVTDIIIIKELVLSVFGIMEKLSNVYRKKVIAVLIEMTL